LKRVFLAMVLLLVLAAPVVWLRGARPAISLDRPLKVVGEETAIQARVASRGGVRRFHARLKQGSLNATLAVSESRAPRWKFWRHRRPENVYPFTAGRRAIPQLQDGPARLILEAQSDDWRGAATTAAFDFVVRTKPPDLQVDSSQHYLTQGGSGVVIFSVGPEVVAAGVRVGPYQFRSWPLATGRRFALFGFPYDVPPQTKPQVWARDEAGNEATAGFWHRVKPQKFRTRDMVLTPDFLRKVTSELAAPTGDLLANFLHINRDLRRRNNQQLADLRWKTADKFLWTEPFRQLADSKVEARFADHRRYFYQGRQVDEQDHLGFDLAVTAQAPVVAANDGQVVFADFLGIYGNCVVIDHGCGLQSIYGHLSKIGVKPGESVRQGQEIGRSGATGLAGGDHLHFSMQVDGAQVNPLEWWDKEWLARLSTATAAARIPAP
jgi:peptidase M23-like protein